MKTISDIRHANLLKLRDEAGSVKRLADRIERSSSQVSQWLNMSPAASGRPRTIGDDTARMLEEKFGKPKGWMDTIHNERPPEAARPASIVADQGSVEEFARFISELAVLAAKADADGRNAIMNMAKAAAQMAELRSGAIGNQS